MTHNALYVDDPDAMRFYELPAHSVRTLQPGDLIVRAGRLVQVTDVRRHRLSGTKTVEFDTAPDMPVTDERFDDVDVTIYRPRPGF